MKFLYFIFIIIIISCSKDSAQEITHTSKQISENIITKNNNFNSTGIKRIKKFSQEKYHILEFTTSDPKIAERCVKFSKIQKLDCGFVHETVDSLNRCIQLEFYKKEHDFYRAVDFPSIIKYNWTDSSLIETLYEDDGSLFSPENMVRPNKIEYLLNDSIITKKINFFNENPISSKTCENCSIDNTVFFLMYSGCDIKFFEKYRMRF